MIRNSAVGLRLLFVLGLHFSCGSDQPKAYDLLVDQPINEAEEEALRLFSNYLPQIENQGTEVKFIRLISGDLNGDARTDVIVEFGKGLPRANGLLVKEAAVYIQEKDQLIVLGAFEPGFCFHISGIEEGKLSVQELDACMNPNPQVLAIHTFKLKNRQLTTIQH